MRLFILLLGLVSVASAAEMITIEGGPRDGRERWVLEEDWRVGGDDEDSVLFGTINQVLVGNDGLVYMLDSQLAHVEVFAADGQHLHTLGGRGEGPGEFNIPLDMVFLPDGSLGVSEGLPGRMAALGADGSPGRVIVPQLKETGDGGFIVLINSRSAGDQLVFGGQTVAIDAATGIQTRTSFVQGFDLEGQPLARYHAEERQWNFRSLTLDEDLIDESMSRLAVLPDGRVVMNIPRNRYELTVMCPEGQIQRVITRPYRSWERNDQANERCRAWLEGIGTQIPGETPTKQFDTEPDVAQLIASPDGMIWVLTSRACWEPAVGILASYDVFSPEGEYLKIVDVVGEGRPESDQLVLAPNGLVFQITGHTEAMMALQAQGGMEYDGAAAAMEVVCYHRR